MRRKNMQSYLEPGLSSRRDLESLYASAIRMRDQDDNKAHAPSGPGSAYCSMLETSRFSSDGRGRSILSLGTRKIPIYALYDQHFTQYCFATDAGGPPGTSQLKILLEIIHRMEYEKERNTDQGLDQIARPCECFDMIGGSGTGGCVLLPFNDS